MIISICTDVAALKEHDSIKIVNDESPAARAKILGTGGTNIFYNGNSSIVCLTGLEGLEVLADLDYVVITSYEEIFGYTHTETHIDEESAEEVEELITIYPISEMKALYDSIYTRTPVTTDLGTYTPPALMGIPGGYDISHLSTGE